MGWLLDTSIYSQVLKKRPILECLRKWEEMGDAQCVVSAVCLAEVEWGLNYAANERLWERYRELLEGRLEVLDVTTVTWRHFSRMKARQRLIGQAVGDLDLLIAASAVEHGLSVATLNKQDFSRIEGVSWEDWAI
jgi:tRNA(fMet)-specific endonuclease VapC